MTIDGHSKWKHKLTRETYNLSIKLWTIQSWIRSSNNRVIAVLSGVYVLVLYHNIWLKSAMSAWKLTTLQVFENVWYNTYTYAYVGLHNYNERYRMVSFILNVLQARAVTWFRCKKAIKITHSSVSNDTSDPYDCGKLREKRGKSKTYNVCKSARKGFD